jgi:hypothetical protein
MAQVEKSTKPKVKESEQPERPCGCSGWSQFEDWAGMNWFQSEPLQDVPQNKGENGKRSKRSAD